MTTGNNDKLDEARKMLDDMRDPHGRVPTIGDTVTALGLLADAIADLPGWVWYGSNQCCPPGDSCCNCD